MKITLIRPGLSVFHPAFWLSTWFGTGLLPKAPGTWGSLAALPCAWVIASLFGQMGLLAAALLCLLIGSWGADIYVRRTAHQDPQEIVIDEVAGQWLVLCAVPPDLSTYAVGFILFRIVDILKPWPACWADRALEGGVGVMADDFLAAFYAAILLFVISSGGLL